MEKDDDQAVAFRTTFHVGFLSVGETQEMLERLRRPEPPEPDSTARSRLFSELRRLGVANPINVLAAIVGDSAQ